MKISENKILFWHLIDLKGKTIYDIAEDMNYQPDYIDNVRISRKAITDKFRMAIARTYPELTNFMVHGEPPKLPESKALVIAIWHMSDDNLEAIANKTGFKPAYVRQIFNGSTRPSTEFLSAVASCYPGIASKVSKK